MQLLVWFLLTQLPTKPPTLLPTKSPTKKPITVNPSTMPTVPPTKSVSEVEESLASFASWYNNSDSPSTFLSLQPTPNFVNHECCVDTGFCIEDDPHTFEIPILDLSQGSKERPSIDGFISQSGDYIGESPLQLQNWIGNEYSLFLELPMFNGGKSGEEGSPLEQEERIGTSYLAYDCNVNIVCVAAHLDWAFMDQNPNVQVKMSQSESWVRFGPNKGETKLSESNSDAFKYISKPDSVGFIIGYEGCWNINLNDEKMQRITNNLLEVHFTRSNGQTTSTGKPSSNGKYICLSPQCERKPSVNPTTSPTRSPITIVVNPYPPTQKPTLVSNYIARILDRMYGDCHLEA